MLVTPNMKGFYPFEGTANDASGNGNNGTVYGATLIDGKFGKGYSFDGVNDYIQLASSWSFSSGTSISMWVDLSNVPNDNVYYYFLGSAVSDYALGFKHPNIFITYFFTIGLVNLVHTPPSGFFHLVMIRNPLDARYILYYINTVYVGSAFANTSVPVAINLIGKRSSGREINAKMDNIQFFDCVLNEQDIKRIYLGLHPLNG